MLFQTSRLSFSCYELWYCPTSNISSHMLLVWYWTRTLLQEMRKKIASCVTLFFCQIHCIETQCCSAVMGCDVREWKYSKWLNVSWALRVSFSLGNILWINDILGLGINSRWPSLSPLGATHRAPVPTYKGSPLIDRRHQDTSAYRIPCIQGKTTILAKLILHYFSLRLCQRCTSGDISQVK